MRLRRRWRRVLGLAGSASLGLTMMACYGGPPVPATVSTAPETATTPAQR
jgi:hypothetical protein